MRYYIIGCAKSGTTLLHRLMYGFYSEISGGPKPVWQEGSITNEIDLYHLMQHDDPCVGKRVKNFPCSGPSVHPDVTMEYAKAWSIGLIYIERSKEAVLESSNGYVSEERYDLCHSESVKYDHLILYKVKFEDIIAFPNMTQRHLSASLGLRIKHKWSTYPDFVPDEAFNHDAGPKYRSRRLGG